VISPDAARISASSRQRHGHVARISARCLIKLGDYVLRWPQLFHADMTRLAARLPSVTCFRGASAQADGVGAVR
jgi:hypothetical protein